MSGAAPEAEPAHSRHDYRFFLLFLLIATVLIAWQFHQCSLKGPCIFAEDFDVFYGPAHRMAEDATAHPYPLEQAKAWVANPDTHGVFHYSLYPPVSLLLFYPLGYFPRDTALMLWFAVQFLALAAAFRTDYLKRLTLAPGQSHAGPCLMLLPFVMITVLAGQVGILCAALFALTLAWRKSRPLPAALALALLAVKPQLALMLPILLLAERNFKVLLLTIGCVLVLAVATVCLWGFGIWRDYFELLALSPQILAIAPPQLLTASLTPALALRMLHLPAQVCLAMQTVLSLTVLLFSYQLFRKADEAGKLLLAATATFLISPYAFLYDAMILAFPAMLLLRRWMTGTITRPQRLVLILLTFLPLVAIKFQAVHIAYGFPTVLAAFIVAAVSVKPAVKD